jgi:hypothetical protein
MILFQSNNFNNHNMNHISRPPLITKLVPNKQIPQNYFVNMKKIEIKTHKEWYQDKHKQKHYE